MEDGFADLSCNCYKIPGLAAPILEASRISYLGDRYVLGEQLGWGQFGLIRSCSDLVTGEILACKSISKDRLVSVEDVRSVKLEIEIMARLSGHPNIVDLKAVYEDSDHVHLIMELCAGGELFLRLQHCGRFTERDAAAIFLQLMEVVLYCHEKGIVHRDLKPENILLATGSTSSPIKLADFGLATYIKPGESLCGTVGSPFYIAPEVLAGGYNQAADVWSAGIILYVLLSGLPPFWGKTKSRIFNAVKSAELIFPSDPWTEISDSAKELVGGMLYRDKAQRLTAKQVLEHSWIKNYANKTLQSIDIDRNVTKSVQKENLRASFLSPNVPATRDFSFGFRPPSPAFTSQTSFSSPLPENAIPPSPSIGFSFHSFSQSRITDIPLSNFSFSIPPPDEQESGLLEWKANTIQRGSSSCRLLETGLHKEAEARKGLVFASRPIASLHSRRNHTIGVGKLEQIDLMPSESVIRWASCAQLTEAAAALRSSLVC